jgi:6-phosphogluconate dehydrogenase
MSGQAFGIIGLEVMGRNIALNIERNGYPIAVFNRTYSKTEDFLNRLAKGKNAKGAKTEQEFVALLEKPRRILIMVKAGKPVDQVIDGLKPFLEPGDIVIDGGNSLFTDTEKRFRDLAPTGIKFFGMGVSGGEEGALWGPSLMPGGDPESYKVLEPILKKVAAKPEDGDGACVAYIGSGGAGHFVKMVHNGIEYGDMQLIAEAYDLLKNVAGLDNRQIKETFLEWNNGVLKSFLIEITAKVIDFMDPKGTGKYLVEMILDKAGQKGTGKWTTQTALDLGVAIPTITSAVDARGISALKDQRVKASTQLAGPQPSVMKGDIKAFTNDVADALYCSKICSYSQGMAMLSAADKEFKYGLHLDEIARIWKAGCIIRAVFLDEIKKAFKEEPGLSNLLMAARFKEAVGPRQAAWRKVVTTAIANGIPTPAFSGSLAYYDSYRRERLPANLIQAQRDFFGAHTYERIDDPGKMVHTEWAGGSVSHEPGGDTNTKDSSVVGKK